MKLEQLAIEPAGHPPDDVLAEWVRDKCGYDVFCGKDRTVSRLTIIDGQIGVERWPEIEMPERDEDPDMEHQGLTKEQFLATSKPTTLLINIEARLVTYLPPLRERGEYDRRHRLGYQWLDRHAANVLEWYSFQKAHDGYHTYVRGDLERWKKAAHIAIDLDFMPENAMITILDSGACQQTRVHDIFETNSLDTMEGGLTPEASALVKVIEKIYKAEQRMRGVNGSISFHDSERAERDLTEEILNIRKRMNAIVPLREDGSIDQTKLMFREGLQLEPASLFRCSRAIRRSMEHLSKAEMHANRCLAGPAIASFSFFKQTLHEMMRDLPVETAMIFGDTRIESIFAAFSGE